VRGIGFVMSCPTATLLKDSFAHAKRYPISALSHMDDNSISKSLRVGYKRRALAMVRELETEFREHISKCAACLYEGKAYRLVS